MWYFPSPMGHNCIGELMPEISRRASLSKRYTNHCLRSTAITILDDQNFASRHIMAVSGHRVESSLKTYSRHTSEETQRKMSHTLTNSLGIENIPPEHPIAQASATDVMPQEYILEVISSEDSVTPQSHNTDIMNNMLCDIDIPDDVLANIPMPDMSAAQFYNAPHFANCSVTVNYNFGK